MKKKVQKDQLQKRYKSLSRQVNEMDEKIKKKELSFWLREFIF